MLPYRIIRPDDPCYLVGAFGHTGTDLFFFVSYSHMSADEVLEYRVEQAKVNGIGGSAAMKSAILEVLEQGYEVMFTTLVEGLRYKEALDVKDREIYRLRAEGHPLRNSAWGYDGHEQREEALIKRVGAPQEGCVHLYTVRTTTNIVQENVPEAQHLKQWRQWDAQYREDAGVEVHVLRAPHAVPAQEPDLPSHERVQRACADILRFLADGAWHTRDEIGTAMALDENKLRRPLDRLVRDKLIECEKRSHPRRHCVFRFRPPLELSLRP